MNATNADVIENMIANDENGIVFNPTTELLAALVERLHDSSSDSEVTVIADEETGSEIRRDFLSAAKLQDLIDNETVDFSVMESESADGAAVIVDDEMSAGVTVKNNVTFTEMEDSPVEFQESVDEIINESWEIDLRTPSLSRIYSSLEDKFGDEFREDVETVFENTPRLHVGDLNEVAAFLLTAAKNEEQLYEISQWAEYESVASKATFSRVKNMLEEQGLITVEKEPIDVGRPRLRLMLAKDSFEDASVDEITEQINASATVPA